MTVSLRELGLPHDPSPECLQVQTRTARQGGRPRCHRPKRMQKIYNPYTNLRCGPLRDPLLAASGMRACIHFFYFGCFFGKFFYGKIKEPYNDVRSAALEVVANNWKSIYSAEICCFQILHRFATKYLKAYTMLRWTALKFVARPRKGTVLDPGFPVRNLIRDRSVFMPKNKKSVSNAEIWCFYMFHRFALKYGKGHTMVR